MQLSGQARQTLQRLYEEGPLRVYQIQEQVFNELSAAGMVTLERHADFSVVVMTEDGKLTVRNLDAPEPDVASGG